MSVLRTQAALRCFTLEPDVAFVGVALDCTPTSTHAAGEPLSARKPLGARREESVWILESRLADTTELGAHLEHLLELVERRASAFDALRARLTRVDLFCFVESGSQGALEFEPELLARLAARRIALSLDLYPSSAD